MDINNKNDEDESVTQQKPEKTGLPYHAPRLVSLGSVQSLVEGVDIAGSDAGPGHDCAHF
jgi:hypothetical protein